MSFGESIHGEPKPRTHTGWNPAGARPSEADQVEAELKIFKICPRGADFLPRQRGAGEEVRALAQIQVTNKHLKKITRSFLS